MGLRRVIRAHAGQIVVTAVLGAGDLSGASVALTAGPADSHAVAADGSSGSGVGSAWPWMLGALVLMGAAILVVALIGRGRARSGGPESGGSGSGVPGPGGATVGHAAASAQPAGPLTIQEQRTLAASCLIEADDAIRTSEQELGFAVAQAGEQSGAPFSAALTQSRHELAEAFHLQCQAQGATGEPDEDHLLEQIIALCRSADGRLDDQVESFDRLRDLERTIGTVLPWLSGQVAGLQARCTASMATTQGVRQKWPPAALGNLVRNLDEAEARVKFADVSLTSGIVMLASGDRAGAVAHARAAEEAIGQATTLLDNVDRGPETLELAQRAISALQAETQNDVAEAESLGLPAEVAAPYRFATDTLAWARTDVESGSYDPIAVRRALEESDTALQRALMPSRGAAGSRGRATALLATTTNAAHASIRAADDFITTRRGAVGADARTRLAEAQRRFSEGLATDDPVLALEHMQAADHLSEQANILAQQDEAAYGNSRQMGGGTSSGGMANVILGGILIHASTPGNGGRRDRGQVLAMGGRTPGCFGGGATRGRLGSGGRLQ